jgi:WD40-like Beta Propeller Repeat
VLLTRQRGNRYLRSWEVWVAEASGGRAKRLRPASNRPIAATWTRDGLASVTTEGTRYLLRPTDGALVTQMPAPTGQEVQAPDGGHVARVRGDTLYLGRVDDVGKPVVRARGFRGLCWSSDSRRLAYVLELAGDRAALELVRADGSDRRRLYAARVLGCGSWSPDGRSLAFGAQHDRTRYQPPRVYVADAAAGRARRLTKAPAHAPVWSPHGSWIAYVRMTPTKTEDRWELFAIRSDGRRVRRLANVGWLAPHAWFPDGIRIATCLPAGVGIVSMRGGRPRLLSIRC